MPAAPSSTSSGGIDAKAGAERSEAPSCPAAGRWAAVGGMTPQRRAPRDKEEAAAFKGLGQAVTANRERLGMDRDELASRCEMTPAELDEIEHGELDEPWGDVRVIAKGLDTTLPALMMEAEEFAPGLGGEQWRQRTREAEAGSTAPGERSDAAEGRKPSDL